jgi:hypothetical protein
MTDAPKRRGRPPKAVLAPTPDEKPAPVKRRRKNIVSANMPYVPPKRQEAAVVALGYRPKKKPSRPVVQPNRI